MRAIPVILWALAGASAPVACITTPANEACAGNCLCFSTQASCPIGCHPYYDIQPDGGGTGQFSCLNTEPAGPEAPDGTGTPPVCPLPEGSTPAPAIAQSELPSGACTGNESCSANVEAAECAGLVNGWTCTCVDETWVCVQTSMGTTACSPDGGGTFFVDAAALE